MFTVSIHWLSSLRRCTYSPYIYTPWCSLGWNFLQGFENLKPYSLLMLWEFLAHMSLWVQFDSFSWIFEVSAGIGWGDKIWITTWGMRRINSCESRRLLLKSLHNEVFCVFTVTVNSPLASFFLHCLSSYAYIDDTLYKQFIEVCSWFIAF